MFFHLSYLSFPDGTAPPKPFMVPSPLRGLTRTGARNTSGKSGPILLLHR